MTRRLFALHRQRFPATQLRKCLSLVTMRFELPAHAGFDTRPHLLCAHQVHSVLLTEAMKAMISGGRATLDFDPDIRNKIPLLRRQATRRRLRGKQSVLLQTVQPKSRTCIRWTRFLADVHWTPEETTVLANYTQPRTLTRAQKILLANRTATAEGRHHATLDRHNLSCLRCGRSLPKERLRRFLTEPCIAA